MSADNECLMAHSDVQFAFLIFCWRCRKKFGWIFVQKTFSVCSGFCLMFCQGEPDKPHVQK